MTPEEWEAAEFRRIELVTLMNRDRDLIAEYRQNEKFYINRLVESSRELGGLDVRLGGER